MDDLELIKKIAFEAGRAAAEKHRLRVTPYYREWVVAGGKKVDVTSFVDQAWLDGYDEQVKIAREYIQSLALAGLRAS